MILLDTATQIAQADLSFLVKLAGVAGAAGVTFAASWGISNIAKSAMEASARQPEVAADIRTNVVLTGAFIEGVALLSAVVCLLAVVVA
ncbi:MAG: ATP synthase F0 subunit C [Bacteroidales bacterium]|nr:ATP synthase F0 subunit C [Bacteroidales bacterium]